MKTINTQLDYLINSLLFKYWIDYITISEFPHYLHEVRKSQIS